MYQPDMAQSWMPMGSQSAVNLQGGPHSSCDRLIERSSGDTADGDGLVISPPQASFIPRDPRDYGHSHTSPINTPGLDRPLLSSPVTYASPQFQQQQFPIHAGPATGGQGKSHIKFSSVPPAVGASKSAAPAPGAAATGVDFSHPYSYPYSANYGTRPTMGQPRPSVPPPEAGHQHEKQTEANDIGMAPIDLGNQSRSANVDSSMEDGDSGRSAFNREYTKIAYECPSTRDVHMKRWGWFSVTVLVLSIYSTCLSCAWFIISIVRPTWKFIGSQPGQIESTTATLLATLFAKTVEMSFVTVFVTFLGQTLSRRAFSKLDNGVTLAELTMRNWVIQPGSLITHKETIRYSGRTVLGVLTLVATLAATFYTTASDAMVSPKLMDGPQQSRLLFNYVKTQYANPSYLKSSCKTPARKVDELNAGESCLNVQYSGESYHTLMQFMADWERINANGTNLDESMDNRPPAKANLFPNTTLVSTWIDKAKSNITENNIKHGRIVNDVTLAMPHAAVYFAATHPINQIPQPQDLDGIGGYEIRAAAVSPVVNVKCVDMTPSELAPLVYTTWPNALNNNTGIPGQTRGYDGWLSGVPAGDKFASYNRTAVDDIFGWGTFKDRDRIPPVWRMYPLFYNVIVNVTGDAIYVLGKHPATTNYTLCELRSWVNPHCSTKYTVSGIKGGLMEAHCEDNEDKDSFARHNPGPYNLSIWRWAPRADWRNVADQLKLSINLDGGITNNNASNARLLTVLAVLKPQMPLLLPSMAEALAVLFSSTLVSSAIDTPVDGNWPYSTVILDQPTQENFSATVTTQGYQSNHADAWQAIFYVVLAAVVAINIMCFAFFAPQWRCTFLTDYTEPANLFGLAIMSPPSGQLRGCCGGGPRDRDLVVPWRVSAFPDWDDDGEGDDLCDNNKHRPPPPPNPNDPNGANSGASGGSLGHPTASGYTLPESTVEAGGAGAGQYHFFFQEAMQTPWRGKWKGTRYGESPGLSSSAQMANSYRRLSNRKSLM